VLSKVLPDFSILKLLAAFRLELKVSGPISSPCEKTEVKTEIKVIVDSKNFISWSLINHIIEHP
jgi:hypothetical protein